MENKIIKCWTICLLIISIILLTVGFIDSFENNKYSKNYGVLNLGEYNGEFEDVVFNGIRIGDVDRITECQKKIDEMLKIINKPYEIEC